MFGNPANHQRGPATRWPAAAVVLALAAALAGCGASSTTSKSTQAAKPSIPAACSKTAPARIAPNPWSPSQRELAPAGADAIRLCRYSGLNDHPRLTLTHTALLTTPSLVSTLVPEFDKLPSQRGAIACPFNDGSEIVALLAYPTAHAVTISVGLRGCENVTNGNLKRIALGVGYQFGPELVVKLQRLTGDISPG